MIGRESRREANDGNAGGGGGQGRRRIYEHVGG